jgi:hypothetical protein
MKNLFLVTLLMLFTFSSFSQAFSEKEMLNALNARKIEMDQGNGDGVFKAQHKSTKKWGMYQYMYEGVNTKELVPMEYDSLKFIPYNGAYSVVYNNGKLGLHLSRWSFGDEAKQSVPCLYDEYKRYKVDGSLYIAFSKDGLWGWVDWKTGEEKTEFVTTKADDLPYPTYDQ